MVKKQYKRRLDRITVASKDNPAEYARQYYWLVVKGRSKAPPRMRQRKKKRGNR